MFKAIQLLCLSVLLMLTTACANMFDKYVEWEVVEPEAYPLLNAVGYAPIDSQMGGNLSEKTLMAMKASKLDAYKELAEQVYGQKIDGKDTILRRMAQWEFTKEQQEEAQKAMIVGVPENKILEYFYPDVEVEEMRQVREDFEKASA